MRNEAAIPSESQLCNNIFAVYERPLPPLTTCMKLRSDDPNPTYTHPPPVKYIEVTPKAGGCHGDTKGGGVTTRFF